MTERSTFHSTNELGIAEKNRRITKIGGTISHILRLYQVCFFSNK